MCVRVYQYAYVAPSHCVSKANSEICRHHSHWKLGKLIALYDDNKITIDGDTAVSFTEDVVERFKSYGWHTLTVADGDNDVDALEKAIEEAKAVTDKPTIIKVKTTIGKWGSFYGILCSVKQMANVLPWHHMLRRSDDAICLDM